jgi:undecaprenyl-diphosphatase
VPTAVIGLAGKEWFESLFASPAAVGLALLATGGLLMVTRLVPAGRRGLGQMGWGRAMLVGLGQGLAITPGLSRSGTTIAVGLLLGLERRLAARFSFVLAVPAIVGALVLELADLPAGREVALAPLAAGGVVAAVSGYLALKLLLSLVQHGRLHWFAWYCWALGLAALIWGTLG